MGLRRNLYLAYADFGRALLSSDAHGEDGDFGRLGLLDRSLRRQARVLTAVAEHHDARHRHTALVADQFRERLAAPGLRPGRGESLVPIDPVLGGAGGWGVGVGGGTN